MADDHVDRLCAWIRSYVGCRVSSANTDERRCLPPHVLLDFGNAGLLGLHVPKQYGGMDLSQRGILSIIEQLGALDLTLAIVVVDSCLSAHSLLSSKSREAQKILPMLAAGRLLLATSITETVLLPSLVTYMRVPSGVIANPQGLFSTLIGEPLTMFAAKSITDTSSPLTFVT